MEIRQKGNNGNDISVRALKASIVGDVLPWLMSSLCLLRRQNWISRPILPLLTRLISALDQLGGFVSSVGASESRLHWLEDLRDKNDIKVSENAPKCHVDGSSSSSSSSMANVFSALYTGDKDHFEGQIGFKFETKVALTLVALGRSTNPAVNGGVLQKTHAIRLWDDSTEELLGTVAVDASCPHDALKYVYVELNDPIVLPPGRKYRITSYEYQNSGDPWYKKEALPDETYQDSMITILQDCYAAGSTSFPGSQNLAAAAYGVPTFWLQLSKGPAPPTPVAPSYGVLATQLSWDARKLSPSFERNASTHQITCLNAVQGWSSALSNSAFITGCHRFQIQYTGTRCQPVVVGLTPHSQPPAKDRFVGQGQHEWGWVADSGSVWVDNKVQENKHQNVFKLHDGDVIQMILDFDHHRVTMGCNGIWTNSWPLNKTSRPLYIALSTHTTLPGPAMSFSLLSAGYEGSSLELHWLLQLLKSSGSLAGRFAGSLIAGSPIDNVEEELLPWLQSQLFSGGLPTASVLLSGQSLSITTSTGMQNLVGPIDWAHSFAHSLEKHPSAVPFPIEIPASTESTLPQSSKETTTPFVLSSTDLEALRVNWNASCTDKSILSRMGQFPECERLMIHAMLRHAPPSIQHEAISSVTEKTVDLSPSIAGIWYVILKLRHWLIKSKQQFNQEETEHTSSEDSSSQWNYPTSFIELLKQVCARAEFLVVLSSPILRHESISERRDLTLWTEQMTQAQGPSTLEPMMDRWKNLSDSDSSKWSNIVGVLRAQHDWRTHGQASDTKEVISGMSPQLTAVVRACDLYIRQGVGAPPDVITALLERRRVRSSSRIYGMQALACVLQVITFPSVLHDAILFLRPGFRGLTVTEQESRETFHTALEPPSATSAYPITTRHYYLKGLEGIPVVCRDAVQSSFQELYTILRDKLQDSIVAQDGPLARSLLCTWCLDYEPRDHQFLLQQEFFPLLHQLFSRVSGSDTYTVSDEDRIMWTAMPIDYVMHELSNGRLTKEQILEHMHSAPVNLIHPNWWIKNAVSSEEQTVAALRLLYADFIHHIQVKSESFSSPGMYTTSTAVQFVPATEISIAKLSDITVTFQTGWTMEVWLYGDVHTGIRTVLSSIGVINISWQSSHLIIDLPHHLPQQTIIKVPFPLQRWVHLAVVYSPDEMKINVFINGICCTTSPMTAFPAEQPKWGTITLGDCDPCLPARAIITRGWVGKMHGFRLWSKARTKCEIFSWYQRVISHHDDIVCNFRIWTQDAMMMEGVITSNVEWTTSRLSLFEGVEMLSSSAWIRTVFSIKRIQRVFRKRLIKIMQLRADVTQRLNLDSYYEKFLLSQFEENSSFTPNFSTSHYSSFHANGGSQGVLPLSERNRWDPLHRVRHASWTVFRYLSTIITSGVDSRGATEAHDRSAEAKKRRQKSRSMNSETASEGESSYSNNDFDVASTQARMAATSTELQQSHALPTLWFSLELQRKMLAILTHELESGAMALQDTQGILRSQCPMEARSMSMPMRGAAGVKGHMEPVALEEWLYTIVWFLWISISTRQVQLALASRSGLQPILRCLRLGSPRIQRIVQLILVKMIPVLEPNVVISCLGSDRTLVELLVDRVAESILGATTPGSHLQVQYQYLHGTNASEALSSPLGVGTGQVHLVSGAEATVLLRSLLQSSEWQQLVLDVVQRALNTVMPLLQNDPIDSDDEVEESNVRFQAAMLRAVGALGVLGAQTDCLRGMCYTFKI